MSAADASPAPRAPGRLAARYGPWAVVTGASSGIGRALAEQLAADGLDLVLVARRQEALEALAADLAARHGVAALVLPLDLEREGATATLAEFTQALDVGLFVAAAGFGTSGPLLEADGAAERGMLAVNCGAVLDGTRHFGARLAARGRGGIILLGSVVGFQGVPRAAHYAATKAYVQSLGEALHDELAPRGVDVIVAAPGPTATGFAARAGMTMGAALTPDTVARATLAALGRRRTVLPGGLSKLLGWSLATLPRWARVGVMGAVMKGMTGR